MGLFEDATDRLKNAVGDAAEDNLSGLRESLRADLDELLREQSQQLVATTVGKVVKAVHDEIQTFASLHLATKEDLARLESLMISFMEATTSPADQPATSVSSRKPAAAKKAGKSAAAKRTAGAKKASKAPARARRPSPRKA